MTGVAEGDDMEAEGSLRESEAISIGLTGSIFL